MADVIRSFEVADYVVFALMLGVSAAIGIYYAFWGNKNNTTGEFLMGGRDMKIVPVAISILVSFMSAILILGTPAEMYNEGTEFFMNMFGLMAAISISAILYVPLMYPLRLTSSFEYLERRFNSKAAKLTGTSIMIIQQVLYMGIASFAPSTALEAVTGFPTWATIITVGLVSTFYTSLLYLDNDCKKSCKHHDGLKHISPHHGFHPALEKREEIRAEEKDVEFTVPPPGNLVPVEFGNSSQQLYNGNKPVHGISFKQA